MIGKIMIGKSFRGCLHYCLEDKLQKGVELSVVKDRAEVLLYHLCYGNRQELTRQFGEVRLLNTKVKKPVLHITLSLAQGEVLGKDKWMEVVEACARDLGFVANQYIAIGHKDTDHQHLHIVANRVGFDGRVVGDSNNYKKMALFCRKMEAAQGLKKVLSPRRYLPSEQQELPRMDERKERLKTSIKQCLKEASSYEDFKTEMKGLGYLVLKGRGILFLDEKGVKVKGSEVGYSLNKIEQVLEQNQIMRQQVRATEPSIGDRNKKMHHRMEQDKGLEKPRNMKQELNSATYLGKVTNSLLRPEKEEEPIHEALFRKGKSQRHKPHL